MMVGADNTSTYSKPAGPVMSINVEDYAVLVKKIAHHMMMRMPPSVQVDDLIQAGMIGLLEASRKYDGSKGASFETYAGIRIRGSIVDEMRRGDWVPRSVHRNTRKIATAISAIEGRTGRDPLDQEVAEELDMTIEEYHTILHDSVSSRLYSFEENYNEDGIGLDESSELSQPLISPLEHVQKESLKNSLAAAMMTLPERERLVLALYYDEELNLKEIGEVIGVSESRVSQIHSQAALRLKSKMLSWDGEENNIQ
ncbi:MAG: RNA polymerase sigma factor FliA [Cellvibrionaceae bacterium]